MEKEYSKNRKSFVYIISLIMSVIIISLIIPIIIVFFLLTNKINEEEYLNIIKNIDPVNVEKISIFSQNKLIKDIKNTIIINNFIKALKETELWKSEQKPYFLEDYEVKVFMNIGKEYSFNFVILKENPTVIFIYATDGDTMNAQYKNIPMYEWIRNNIKR